MDRAGKTFQNKLRKRILLYTTTIIAILLILFLGSLVLYDHVLIENQADNVNQYFTGLFTSTYTDYVNFLKSLSGNENFRNYILNEYNPSSVYYSYYTFNTGKKIKSNLVLTDYDGNVLLETFSIKRDNDYFTSFTKMMKERILASGSSDNIVTGLYSFIETASEYVIAGPVAKNGKIIGFVMLYLNGDDWNYEISAQEFNGIITDRFGNVIATSSKMIVGNMNKFKPGTDDARISISGTEYIIRHTWLQAQDINIYSLVKAKTNIYQYLFGIVIILALGLSMLAVTEIFSKKIAVNTSKSIDKLISEIYVIKNGDLDYRVRLDTGDEIETIAESVNDLVERINALNKRNTELIDTRRISEIKQLEAQFNPHFLYNTLETVRYSIFFDQQAASELISLLTQVLRYSISRGSDEVKFSESLEYTNVFLKIYKFRYDKNFDYTIDISDECNDIPVPKLLLQPIIENSIKYGYSNKTTLKILISARIKDGYLMIAVEDDGPGIVEEELARLNAEMREETSNTDHIGLFNTARRLSLQFGNESGIQLESKVNEGTRVTIRIKVGEDGIISHKEGGSLV